MDFYCCLQLALLFQFKLIRRLLVVKMCKLKFFHAILVRSFWMGLQIFLINRQGFLRLKVPVVPFGMLVCSFQVSCFIKMNL